ncbi:MAG: hypothetical protein ACI9S8_000316 [Chlamydiales bacterium]|jgi:hypothetical protein
MRAILGFIFAVILVFIIPSCSGDSHQLSEKESFGYKIIGTTAKVLEKRYKLQVIGSGASMPDMVRSLNIHFRIDRPIEKLEARKIIVDCASELIKNMNNSEVIRPYLQNYPVTSQNIEVTLFSYYPDGSRVYFPLVHSVAVRRGGIAFFTKDPEHEFGYKTEEYETFEEALEILKQDKK